MHSLSQKKTKQGTNKEISKVLFLLAIISKKQKMNILNLKLIFHVSKSIKKTSSIKIVNLYMLKLY